MCEKRVREEMSLCALAVCSFCHLHISHGSAIHHVAVGLARGSKCSAHALEHGDVWGSLGPCGEQRAHLSRSPYHYHQGRIRFSRARRQAWRG